MIHKLKGLQMDTFLKGSKQPWVCQTTASMLPMLNVISIAWKSLVEYKFGSDYIIMLQKYEKKIITKTFQVFKQFDRL